MMNRMHAGYALFASLTLSLFGMNPAVAEVTIEVLNPRGEIVVDEVFGVSPRLPAMAGTTIGLYGNGKNGLPEFLNVVEGLFRQKYPGVTVKRYSGAFDVGDKLASQIAKEVDAVVYGVGD